MWKFMTVGYLDAHSISSSKFIKRYNNYIKIIDYSTIFLFAIDFNVNPINQIWLNVLIDPVPKRII